MSESGLAAEAKAALTKGALEVPSTYAKPHHWQTLIRDDRGRLAA